MLGESGALRRSASGPELPERPGCVVVVGPSCSGKTTLVDAIRQAELPQVFVATRFVTRPRRKNDSSEENVHLDYATFHKRKELGEIAWSWTRSMHENKLAWYGFNAAPAGALRVYSANNALYRNADSIDPASAIQDALWVGAFAPIEIRRQRMQERSADLSEAEREFRLADLGADMPWHVHLVAHGYGDTAAEAKAKICEVVAALTQSLPV